MMNRKNIVFIISYLLLFTVSAQKKSVDIEPPYLPIDEHTQLITYQYTVQVEGSPDSIYTRALAWAKKYYQNPTQVIKEANSETKVIDCVSNIKITTPSKDKKTQLAAGYVYYGLKIEAREGRYRYTITNFNLRGAANQPIEIWLDKTKPEWSPMKYEHLKQVDEGIQKLIENLEEEMEPKPILHDDW